MYSERRMKMLSSIACTIVFYPSMDVLRWCASIVEIIRHLRNKCAINSAIKWRRSVGMSSIYDFD